MTSLPLDGVTCNPERIAPAAASLDGAPNRLGPIASATWIARSELVRIWTSASITVSVVFSPPEEDWFGRVVLSIESTALLSRT